MSMWHVILTALALGGLGLAVWMEVKRARHEDDLWYQVRRRLGELGGDPC